MSQPESKTSSDATKRGKSQDRPQQEHSQSKSQRSSESDRGAAQEAEHPDAPPRQASPFPLASSSTSYSQPYRDDPDETSDHLVRYEPRPIDEPEGDDEEEQRGIAAERARPRKAWRASLRIFWLRNMGMFLVLLAQMFGASMNVMTQILEIHSSMHPFQVLFARMSITAVASYLYMWYAQVPAPFGIRPVRKLLLLRATFGFLGVYGLYYSVQYLPLSEATVITFLAPILTCYACSFLIPGETFTRRQQLAALVSLIGVVLIARPFSSRSNQSKGNTTTTTPAPTEDESPNDTDSFHHVLATVVAFVGVLGASGAYTTIRVIGRRAHPLVSVTYFSSVTTIISLVAMVAVPSIPFRLPSTATEWILLTGLGVCGFLLQFLLTAGLSYVPPASVRDKGAQARQGSKATNMVYTQMLFALFYDKVIWGSTMSPVSWAGSALILACAVYVAVAQEGRREEVKKEIVGEPNLTPPKEEEEEEEETDVQAEVSRRERNQQPPYTDDEEAAHGEPPNSQNGSDTRV
ncbi:hypothetical protein PDE_06769 [Penicillium oxalicum 114-2]|uniref:EamA domain-containing protein n=1 Tax=Penicillium oxalicum (strain 114-2 / CGMCC 5302) TaxID=933388 RepID=S7ZSY3_PENO1|nr:hypothetical protein PDE_06769 [Penicillium oxalicum 114-2]